VIGVERVDYVRVPATDMDAANHFYGELLGLRRNPNSPSDDWVEYEVGNVTLAVMTPHTHDYGFAPLPDDRARVPDVARRRPSLSAGLQVGRRGLGCATAPG
jgi:catechol 2,3-dioxygenase-like lactoylglutathione lyase family enzyme